MPVVHVCSDFRWVDRCSVCRHELQAYCFQAKVSAMFPFTEEHTELKIQSKYQASRELW